MKVVLNDSEFYRAANTGLQWQIVAKKRGLREAYGAEEMDGWEISIEGACAEMAVAKHFNKYWNGNVGDVGGIDIGPGKINIEVRSTSYDNGHLILHPKNDDDSYFILVTGEAPEFYIKGWIKGIDGKKEEFWGDKTGRGRPCYWVPQHKLNPLNTLPI